MVAKDYHNTVAHGSRSKTMQEIRRAVYLIIICNAIVRHVIFSCIRCRSMRRRFGEQMIADLPKDCVRKAPSFTYCGFDLFGPFLVKER